MNLYRWFAWRQWPWLPVLVRRWQKQYRQDAIYQMLAPSVLGAQAAGVGIVEAWASPENTSTHVLEWIEKQFVSLSDPHGRAADVVKILIAHCHEHEFDSSETGNPLHLPASALVIHWLGRRSTWFWEGYDAVQQALPNHHNGLYVAVNNVGVAFTAVATSVAPQGVQ